VISSRYLEITLMIVGGLCQSSSFGLHSLVITACRAEGRLIMYLGGELGTFRYFKGGLQGLSASHD
jgi:hypothetical protein